MRSAERLRWRNNFDGQIGCLFEKATMIRSVNGTVAVDECDVWREVRVWISSEDKTRLALIVPAKSMLVNVVRDAATELTTDDTMIPTGWRHCMQLPAYQFVLVEIVVDLPEIFGCHRFRRCHSDTVPACVGCTPRAARSGRRYG